MGYNYLMTNKTTHDYFNPKSHFLQLSMNFDVGTIIPEDSKVKLVCKIIERMDLSALSCTGPKKGRKPAVDLVDFIKIILFCYSEGKFSNRKIEDFCLYDIRGRYLLSGRKAPDHSTISRFQDTLKDHMEYLLTQFVKILIEDKHVDLKSLYIDGTKIEAVANRYTFVWRKSVEKHQNRLKERIIQELDMSDESTLEDVISRVKTELNLIRNLCRKLKIEFVYGSGHRKSQEQRKYEYYSDIKGKFENYKQHLEAMGIRNNYSKTDQDATFMRMKDDHMRNGQLKPAYNIQMASSGAFIVGVMGSQQSNDLHTLKPFLEQMLPTYGDYIKNIVADAGYESVENYAYLESKGLKSYIKPSNHEIKNSSKVKNDIGRRENMQYQEQDDCYICKAGKKLVRRKDSINKTASGFEDINRVYTCIDCKGCQYSTQCIRSRSNPNPDKKTLKFSPAFEVYRRRSEVNIATEEGINERINRSIQAEGAFSKVKDGLAFDRFRHKGMKKIVADMIMVAMGINLNKLHSKILNNQIGVIVYKKAA